jgi:hypothetical protein
MIVFPMSSGIVFLWTSDAQNPIAATAMAGGHHATDTTPPVTTATIPGGIKQDWYNVPVVLTLTATDSQSGVQFTLYNRDSGGWSAYSSPLASFADGSHTVLYYSVDWAGNVEGQKTLAFKVDNTDPTTPTIALISPTGQVSGSGVYDVWWNAAYDALSGIHLYFYSFNQYPTLMTYGDMYDFCLPTDYLHAQSDVLADGTWYFHIETRDNAGNIVYTHSTALIVDRVAPVTQCSMSGTGGPVSFNGNVLVTLTATDDRSGVMVTYYVLDGTQSTYTGPFWATTLGTHTLQYFSADRASNLEATKTCTFQILPGSTYTLTVSAPSSTCTDPAAGTHSYASGTLVTLSADYDFFVGQYHYVFMSWRVDGSSYRTLDVTVTMNKDHSATAVYKKTIYM